LTAFLPWGGFCFLTASSTISFALGLSSTAKIMVDSAFARNPKFQVYTNFDGWMLSNLTAGMTPVSNLFDAVTQVALGGIFRFISLFYLNLFWRIIRTYQPPSTTTTAATTTTATATSSKKKLGTTTSASTMKSEDDVDINTKTD
jgi:hypothetical protein